MTPPSPADSKRCFQCGASYAPDVLSCQLDETPLCFDTIGRRWRVDGLLRRRAGSGGTFTGFHLVSGARGVIDHVPWPLTEDPHLGGRLYREVQALRVLERHPHVPRLLETGTDRDGSRFLVTDLGEARALRDVMDEWRRPDGGALVAPARATQLLGPVLSLLAMAHRLGVSHGSLDAAEIFLQVTPSGGEVVRLHGLALHKTPGGSVSAEAAHADVRAVAAVLHELLLGRAPGGVRMGAPSSLNLKLAAVLDRALAEDPAAGYASAEELARALMLAAPPPVSVQSAGHRVSMAMPTQPSGPGSGPMTGGVPVLSGAVKLLSGPVPIGVTQQNSSVPLPLTPLAAPLPKAGLTGELAQVRVLDLLEQQVVPRGESELFELPAAWPPPDSASAEMMVVEGLEGRQEFPQESSYVDIQMSMTGLGIGGPSRVGPSPADPGGDVAPVQAGAGATDGPPVASGVGAGLDPHLPITVGPLGAPSGSSWPALPISPSSISRSDAERRSSVSRPGLPTQPSTSSWPALPVYASGTSRPSSHPSGLGGPAGRGRTRSRTTMLLSLPPLLWAGFGAVLAMVLTLLALSLSGRLRAPRPAAPTAGPRPVVPKDPGPARPLVQNAPTCPPDMVGFSGGQQLPGQPGPFCLDQHEVTGGDYHRCERRSRDLCPPIARAPGGAQRPLVQANLAQAAGYCQAHGKRLPSRAESDYAAAALGQRRFPYALAQGAAVNPDVIDLLSAGFRCAASPPAK